MLEHHANQAAGLLGLGSRNGPRMLAVVNHGDEQAELPLLWQLCLALVNLGYAVTVLDVPLIVVLGHDSCGAVQASLAALDEGKVPTGFVRDVVERVTPSIMLGRRDGLTRVDEFEARHVIETGSQLLSRSSAIAERVERGKLAIAGVTYRLADGRIMLREHLGDIGERPDESPEEWGGGPSEGRAG